MMKAIYTPKGMAREYAPLACNLYTGCAHGCRYCFVTQSMGRDARTFQSHIEPRRGILDALAKEAPRYRGASVLFCFTCDPYPPGDLNTLTREALRILRERGVRYEILTKSGLRGVRDFDLLQDGAGRYATTLMFTEEDSREYWEPKAASLEERRIALEIAHDADIETWVSVEPVIDPRQAIALIEELSPVVDIWKVGKLNHHAAAASVDWYAFGRDLAHALKQVDCRYFVKDSLRPFMPEGFEVDTVGQDPWHQNPMTQNATEGRYTTPTLF